MTTISRLRLTLLLVLGITLFAADGVVAQPTPIDLGTLGGSFSYPSGLNNRGEVVGNSTTATGTFNIRKAFLWTGTNGMVDLGTLGGAISTAADVNNRGQVVGTSLTRLPLPGTVGRHAFLWTTHDGMVDLHAPLPGGLGNSSAGAINDRGRVVGIYDTYLGVRAFSWTATEGMIDLGTLGGRTAVPSAVSNTDQVVGSSSLINMPDPFGIQPRHAFSWTPTGGMVDLGTLGGPRSGAEAVNEKGDVVGWAEIDESLIYHAFLWTSTQGMVDLGTLGGTSSYAYDVNAAGTVVGFSYTTGDSEVHAFRWTAAEGMVDLGTLGGTNSFAYAVNDRGQVVGRSQTAESVAGHAFVWTASTGMVDLAPLTGHASSDAFLVNNSGQVVGISYSESENIDARATMWLASAQNR